MGAATTPGAKRINVPAIFGLPLSDHVHLYFSKNLHAKCYLNEKKMIITSMNLYEFSQVNNREMAFLSIAQVATPALHPVVM